MIVLWVVSETLLTYSMHPSSLLLVRRVGFFSTALAVTFAVTIGAAPRFARAELGGVPTLPAASAQTVMKLITSDASTLTDSNATAAAAATAKAAATSTSTGYTVRTETLASGTVEREYVSTDGVVFGVAWNGPSAPDFPTLFGTSAFTNYTDSLQAARADGGTHGRAGGPVAITTSSGLVVQMAGHQRALYGRAYMADLLPSGVSASDIQ